VNLVSNALDAVDKNGRIEIAARPVGDDVLITVRDTGHGIPPDDLRRIFEPFYTTKGRGKGTGLGLAICRQLTAALGGAISVESVAGEGSTFTLRLPVQGPPPASTGNTGEIRLRTAGGRA
jgi:two-component system NtrC family sensor kinase